MKDESSNVESAHENSVEQVQWENRETWTE
jgi:hypothetical protein